MPSAEVRSVAERVADDLGLERDWLDDGAKAFIQGDDPAQVRVYEGESLQVAAASPQLLLAMKLLAARVERDTDDIQKLYDLCGFTTAEEGAAARRSRLPCALIRLLSPVDRARRVRA